MALWQIVWIVSVDKPKTNHSMTNIATFGLNNGGPLLPFNFNSRCFDAYLWIVAQAPYRFGMFWHFSHFHAQPGCGPNVSKCYVDWTWQGSGATPKSAGVAGEIGLMPVQHWYLQAGWELLYALLGSFRIVKRDTWWCLLCFYLLCFYLLCFYLLCFYFYHFFVCFCSRKRPWDMRPLGHARAPQWWDSWPLLLCQLHEATADQSERLQEEVGCQLWSVQIWWQWQVHYIILHLWAEFGRFVCLCLFLTGPISAHSRSRWGPESSRATTALGRGQLRQSRFEPTRKCLRTFAMSCY